METAMTNNKFLQRVYEANPDGWEIQALCGIRGWVVALNQESDEILEHTRVRLRPILPEGLPEPPEEAFAYGPEQPGGYPLGYGLDRGYKMQTFSGWICRKDHHEKYWERCDAVFFNLPKYYYILDLRDEHAEEIIAAYEPKEPATIDVSGSLPSRLEDTLIALGWTPHSDDEWVGLDEGELQVNDGCGWHQIDIRGLDGLLDLLEALTSKSHGPAAVRVRKRGGS